MSRWAGTGGTAGVGVGCRVGGVWGGRACLPGPSPVPAQLSSILFSRLSLLGGGVPLKKQNQSCTHSEVFKKDSLSPQRDVCFGFCRHQEQLHSTVLKWQGACFSDCVAEARFVWLI